MANPDVDGQLEVEPVAMSEVALKRRHLLCEAARKVFTEKGWARARTRDIAQEAGVTETVLYRYFPSKEALFEAAILEPLEALVADLTELIPSYITVNPRNRAPISNRVNEAMHQRLVEIAPLLCIALFSDSEKGKAFYQERVVPSLREASNFFSTTLRPKAREAVPPEDLIIILLGMHFAVATQEMLSDQPVDPTLLARTFTEVMAFGLPRSAGAKKSGKK
jgi:TetR/AcrR family transcriptional regulator